ncbi:MAG: SPOR domain-containing protein [Candidatus Omnitrophica bacterium]|nr:SPOR domain-containing protein [Candidatus Omnitrophota bacterium]
MPFGFKSREKSELHSLTENDIRSRLYGSAVGIAADIQEKHLARKRKEPHARQDSPRKDVNSESIRIKQDLEALRQELEQTKRKLKRMRGVKAKKIRLLIISSIAFILVIVFAIAAIRFVVGMKRTETDTITPVSAAGNYTIQVAVSDSSNEAQKFTTDLQSKGYKAFMHKSQYQSGKDKFIIYVGSFKDARSAGSALSRLKSRENIEDSFITAMPR